MTATRGTTNKYVNGNNEDRRRRREWLVETFRADKDADVVEFDQTTIVYETARGYGQPACRCYRCGELLTVDTVTADRIIAGCHGGTYRRNNIRPACGTCNSSTGGQLGAQRKAMKARR